MANLFREKLEGTDDFLLTFELVPGRSSRGRSVRKVLSFAQKACEEGLLNALSITDNPGGNPSLSPDVLGREIKEMGIEPVVHFACRDWNRYGAFSRALQLDGLSIENLLVVTGDYPAQGPEGTAKPCFDLDSVTMMCMLDGMNKGSAIFCTAAGSGKSEKTNFSLGAAVSCLKHAESEVINQYFKLLKKVRNGARFAVTQICYDARKLDELHQFLRRVPCDIPVLGSVCILREPVARSMNDGGVPGAFVTDKLLHRVQSEAQAPDAGKTAALTRAARLIAVLKGLGYRGAHIVGSPVYDDIKDVILKFRQIQAQWRDFLPEFDLPYQDGFYLYEKDEQTGLNSTRPSERSRRLLAAGGIHMMMKTFHNTLFKKDTRRCSLIQRVARIIDKISVLRALLFFGESLSKSLLFDCKKCGDCALPDMAYLCPESQCPKYMRNGACGGSDKGRCEVRKEKLCVWVKVFERLKSNRRESNLNGHCIPPRNWALNGTSSWLNFYLDRDYHASALHLCERIKQPQ
ncbi:MAG: methylenetetrahydrofolate reductase C-terminal domain-containing protein [Planctomycetota bacterium]|jgi:methylenetetrahydrofolate reductase (NADPH)